jgi:hypothetical protein
MARIDLGDGAFIDPDLIQQGIDHLNEGLATLASVITTAQTLEHIVSPDWQGKEPLTQSFHKPMQTSHQDDIQGYLALRAKLTNQVANLQAVKKYYTDADQAGARGLKQKDA